MKQFLKFSLCFVVGLFLLTIVSSIVSIFFFRSDYSESKPSQKEAQVQYIDIRGKKGNATLYTSMPKDSVLVLVGKPDVVNLHSAGNTIFETWGYKIKNSYVSDLDIDFQDGKLTGIRQN